MNAVRLVLIPVILAVSACTVVGYPAGAPAAPAPAPRRGPDADTTADTTADTNADTTSGDDFDDVPDAVPTAEPLSRSGNPDEYEVFGKTYRVMDTSKGYVAEGLASWYGEDFQGKRTSSGEPFDMYLMTAAHKTLPLPTYVEVTNLANGRKVVVRVNDRGPFHEDRIIDLSFVAATKLGIVGPGTARVRVRAMEPAAR